MQNKPFKGNPNNSLPVDPVFGKLPKLEASASFTPSGAGHVSQILALHRSSSALTAGAELTRQQQEAEAPVFKPIRAVIVMNPVTLPTLSDFQKAQLKTPKTS